MMLASIAERERFRAKLKISAETSRDGPAVLFQNTAIMVEKTPPFGLKNSIRPCAALFFSEALFLLTKYVTSRKRRRCEVDIFIWVLAHKKNICLESYKD